MSYVFHNCTIDLSTFDLQRRGRPVKIEPKVFDVLVYLIEHRDRVVTKIELLDSLWPGEAVSDSVLPRCVAAARRAVGDTRTKQRVIQTVHGRGYRFVAELSDSTSASESREIEPGDSVSPGNPSTQVITDASKFVGRGAALAKLEAALARARAGSGNVALVVGEPGIGKTRIAIELMRIASEQKAQILVGRCYEGEGAPAYWPWIQVLRAAIESSSHSSLERELGSGVADIAELLPELRTRIEGIPASIGPEGEQAQFRLFEAAANFLLARSKRVPLLIVIDDLHWADASSLGLLRFLATELSQHSILLLGTYRDVEIRRGHPLADTLGALARQTTCERIALAGLETPEIEAFVAAQAGALPRDGLAETLQEMTDGNPFFLREVVQLLSDQEDLSGADPARLQTLALPQGVRDAIGRRLTALSDECNTMLRAAAVLGRDFAMKSLAGMLSLSGHEPGDEHGDERVDEPVDEPADRLLELLGEALDAGAILESGRGRYSFVHALTKQTLYDELSAPQRITLHRRAGHTLEAALGDRHEERVAELAHHFFEAAPGGDVEKAVAYAVAAAERAHRLHAYDEAVQHYKQALEALDLMESNPEERRAELTLALGEALCTAGARDAGHARLRETAELARRISRTDLFARAAIAVRGFGEMGAPATAETIALVEEALDAVDETEYGLRASLLARFSAMGVSTMSHRQRYSLEALELATRSGDSGAMRDALSARWWATLGPDHVEERLEVAEAMRAHAEATKDIHCLLMSLECALGAHLLLGASESVARTLDEYEATAATIRQPLFIFMGMVMRVADLMNRAEFEEAESLRTEAEAYGKGRAPFAVAISQGQFHWSLLHRGEDTQGEVRESATNLAGLIEEYLVNASAGRILGAAVLFSSSDYEAKGKEMIASFDHRSLERDEHWLLAMGILCDVAFAAGDRPLMEELYARLEPYRNLMLVHDLLRTCSGSMESCLGELATGLERYTDAIEHFERASAKEADAGTASAIPSSQLGLARALLRRGDSGDLERAREIAETLDNLPSGQLGANLEREMAALRPLLAG